MSIEKILEGVQSPLTITKLADGRYRIHVPAPKRKGDTARNAPKRGRGKLRADILDLIKSRPGLTTLDIRESLDLADDYSYLYKVIKSLESEKKIIMKRGTAARDAMQYFPAGADQ